MTKQQKALHVKLVEIIALGYEIRNVFYSDINNAYVTFSKGINENIRVTLAHYTYNESIDYFMFEKCVNI